MGTADFGAKNKNAGIALQLPIALAINGSGEDDARIGKALQPAFIARVVRIVANHYERPIGFGGGISLENQVEVVLRLEAADAQNVFARRKVEVICEGSGPRQFGSVGDHIGAAPVAFTKISLDEIGVRQQASGRE